MPSGCSRAGNRSRRSRPRAAKIEQKEQGRHRWIGSRARWQWWSAPARSGRAGAMARHRRCTLRAAAPSGSAAAGIHPPPEETGNTIREGGGQAVAFTADVAWAHQVEAMVAACLKEFGRIDVLDN